MARPESTLTLDQLSHEQITASVKRTIAETRRIYADRNNAVEAAIEKGELSFFVARPTRTFLRERRVFIISLDDGKYKYFSSAVVDSRIADIKNPDRPLDFFVREGRDINKSKDVAKSLAEYINEQFPHAQGIPIAFYSPVKKFREAKPYSKYSYPDDFVT